MLDRLRPTLSSDCMYETWRSVSSSVAIVLVFDEQVNSGGGRVERDPKLNSGACPAGGPHPDIFGIWEVCPGIPIADPASHLILLYLPVHRAAVH